MHFKVFIPCRDDCYKCRRYPGTSLDEDTEAAKPTAMHHDHLHRKQTRDQNRRGIDAPQNTVAFGLGSSQSVRELQRTNSKCRQSGKNVWEQPPFHWSVI